MASAWAALHRWMQRFYPAIHHRREAGQIGHVGNGQAGVDQRLAGAAGRNDFDAVTDQLAGEFGDAGFVGHRNQGARRTAQMLGHGVPLY
jgi:hypothetical protein